MYRINRHPQNRTRSRRPAAFIAAIGLSVLTAFNSSAQEAYAVLDGSTLTFRYDSEKPDGAFTPGAVPMMTAMKVTTAVFDSSFASYRPTSCAKWFTFAAKLTEIKGMKENLNTEDVTDMSEMFSSCMALKSIDLDSFNTANVTTMNKMFGGCSGLTSLDLSSFNTAKVTDMGAMFSGCKNLVTIFVSDDWTTDSVTSSEKMFLNCATLCGGKGSTVVELETYDHTYARIDGGASDAGYFTRAGSPVFGGDEAYAVFDGSTLTFRYDQNKPELAFEMNTGTATPKWSALSAFVTKVVFDESFRNYKPTTCAEWFADFAQLTDTSIVGMNENLNFEKVTHTNSMFENCAHLKHIDLSGCLADNLQDMTGMFALCHELQTVDISGFDTKNVRNMFFLFTDCPKLRTIYVGDGWNADSVTIDYAMFYNCMKLHGSQGTHIEGESENYGHAYARIDGGADNPGLFSRVGDPAFVFDEAYTVLRDSVLTFIFDKNKPADARDFEDLMEYELGSEWKVGAREAVFDESFKNFVPKSLRAVFYNCSNLTKITGMKEYLNTSQAADFSLMFKGCKKLTVVDLSGFNTENAGDISQMFAGSGFTQLDLTSFDTRKVYTMSGLFSDCGNLATVDLSSFNTEKVNDLSFMFSNCRSLAAIDLSGFNPKVNESVIYMFSGCGSLKTIFVSDKWTNDSVKVSSDMFTGCTNLVGGKGTAFNSDSTNNAYAKIDGGADAPGYFSTVECTGIAITSLPKTEYTEGEDFSDDGGKITISYNNGTSVVVDLSKAEILGYDKNKPGEQTLKVTYLGQTTELKVSVAANNTGVADEAATALNIYAYGKTIVVENAANEIRVYDAMGRLVVETPHCDVSTEIRVNNAGLYIVKTGNAVKRVIVND